MFLNKNKHKNGGNGSHTAKPQSGAAKGSNPLQSFMEDLASSQQQDSAIRYLVNPGDSPLELLMRTVFKDAEEANACIVTLHKIIRFDMGEKYKQIVLMKLASNCSIKGMSRLEVVEVLTGLLLGSAHNQRLGVKNSDVHKGNVVKDDNKEANE